MMLWTWQGTGFDPFKDRVDRSKSEFVDDHQHPDLLSAYEELDGLLSLPEELKHQFVWCFTTEPDFWDRRGLWRIEVPDDCILSLVDSPLWHRLIGNRTVPDSRRDSWTREVASQQLFGDKRAAELAKREREYLAACPPRDECLRKLRLPTNPGPDISALVQVPLCRTWLRTCDLSLQRRW